MARDLGNPSGSHRSAQAARRLLDDARDTMAELLGARPGEVVFTSGGTEADNLARGRRPRCAAGSSPCARRSSTTPCSSRSWSSAATWSAVRPDGPLDLDALAAALDDTVSLVSVMLVNNETGVVQPLDEVAAALPGSGRPGAVAAHRRGAGVRVARRGRARRAGADSISVERPQVRRADGHRRARRARRARRSPPSCSAADRSATGAAARRTWPGRWRWPRRPRRRGRRSARPCRPRRRPWRDRLVGGLAAAAAGTHESAVRRHRRAPRPTGRTRWPASRTSASTASRARRCCSCSTTPASRPRPASSCASGALDPSHVLAAMGVDRRRRHGARCASRSAGRTIEADIEACRSTRSRPRSPGSGAARERHCVGTRAGGHVGRGRLVGRRGAAARRRPRRRRRHAEAVGRRLRHRVLLGVRRRRRAAGRRSARHRPPHVQLRRRLRRARRRALRGRPRRRAHAQPVRGLQPPPQVRPPAAPRRRARVRRGSPRATTPGSCERPDGTRRVRPWRRRGPRTSRTCCTCSTRHALARVTFPVGTITKDEVRPHRRRPGAAHGRQARQPGRVLHHLHRRPGARSSASASPFTPGRLVDTAGHEVGRVDAVELVTIGQRRGLGLAGGGEPRYAVVGRPAVGHRHGRQPRRPPQLATSAVGALEWAAPPGRRGRCRCSAAPTARPAAAVLDAPRPTAGDRALGGAPRARRGRPERGVLRRRRGAGRRHRPLTARAGRPVSRPATPVVGAAASSAPGAAG